MLFSLKQDHLSLDEQQKLQQKFVNLLKDALKDDPDFSKKDIEFWQWLSHTDFANVVLLAKRLTEHLEDSNLWFVENNSLVSYCTGSHNNAIMLRSAEQSKGATFYISPYMAKNKVNPEHCLVVFKKAREHFKKNPSTVQTDPNLQHLRQQSSDETGTAQAIITRTANHLNRLVEVSEHQVCASLLNLPSEITSDTFSYVSPVGCMAYQTYLKINKKEEEISTKEI